MAQILIENLFFTHEGSSDTVFSNLSLTLDTDWKLGFIGRNGRGKTTLLNILAGRLPVQGKVVTPFAFEVFPFVPKDLTAPAGTVAAMAYPGCEEWRLLREMGLLELPEEVLHRAFSSLSGGERTKLLLALMFLREENFPLIDEPTNHLDLAGRALVGRYLASKTGFILATHDRALLDGCVDHILSLEKTGAKVMAGTYTSWERERLRREAYEVKTNEKLKKDILRLDTAAQRTARWSFAVEKTRYQSDNSGVKIDRGYVGHKSAKLMKRAKSAEARKTTAAEEKSKLLRNIEQVDPIRIDSLTHHSKTLVTIENLQVWYGKTPATPKVSLTVKQGERVALTGKNGCGKTSLLKLVAGEELKHTGLMQTASGLVVSVVSQETAWLKGDLRAITARFQLDRTRFFTMLRKLGLERMQFEKDVEHFSAGQKKKVLLAKSLCERAHLYLWDEPLNFIDLDSRKQIEDLILDSMPTMLFVEHDAVFLDRVATKRTALV